MLHGLVNAREGAVFAVVARFFLNIHRDLGITLKHGWIKTKIKTERLPGWKSGASRKAGDRLSLALRNALA
jgi:hypothetical protein